MSSQSARDAINAAVEAAAGSVPVYDLSDYHSSSEVLKDQDSTVILVQYVTAEEQLVTVGAVGSHGFRENGSVVLHIVEPTGFASDSAVTLGDQIREYLRGRRLNSQTHIRTCEPFTDFGGSAVGLEGGAWKGWASNLSYERHDCG